MHVRNPFVIFSCVDEYCFPTKHGNIVSAAANLPYERVTPWYIYHLKGPYVANMRVLYLGVRRRGVFNVHCTRVRFKQEKR